MIIKADIFARAARYCRWYFDFDIRINLDVLLFEELHRLLVARLVDVPENDGGAETAKLKEREVIGIVRGWNAVSAGG